MGSYCHCSCEQFDQAGPMSDEPSDELKELDAQEDLFGFDTPHWRKEWVGMPEFTSHRVDPELTATVKFRTVEDFEEFKRLNKKYVFDGATIFAGGGQFEDSKQTWYPALEKMSVQQYLDEDQARHPKFPIYIVSKGRYEINQTSRALREMEVDHFVVVEKDEYQKYLDHGVAPADRLLVLPQSYKDQYDTFWKDDNPKTGAGPARNFAWDHSIRNGHKRHWVMDDNIDYFCRLNNNNKARCGSGTCIALMEDFVLRYTNVGLAGPHYQFFVPWSDKRPAFVANCRIYSCLLIRNDLPFRWRGRHNEDTDLSLRVMKAGYSTIQFNAFLQGKAGSMALKGGNTEEFYNVEEESENRKVISEMLVEMHPDIARMRFIYGRWHHYVDYSQFAKNLLKRREDFIEPEEIIDNHGLYLTERSNEKRI